MLLHPHNKTTYSNILRLFRTTNRVAAVQPTGTGKSFLMLQLIGDNKDKHFLIFSPSSYIFSQIKTHAENNGVIIENCDFITYSRLSMMTEEELAKLSADYIILDEFHRCGAVEWSRGVENLLAAKPIAKVMGTSATPMRYLDSCRNMAEELFGGNYAVNMSLAEAIREKILPLPVYVTSMYSFSGEIARLEKRAEASENPYFKKLLLGKIRKAKTMVSDMDCGLDRIFQRHIANKSGKYIVFCANVERLNQAFSEADEWFHLVNQRVEKYKVFSRNSESESQFEAFCGSTESGAIRLLFCIDMLNEGVHVEGIDGVIMLRATQSANVFYQQLGRALSCSKGAKPVIFDIVNNYETGDAARQYSEIMEIGRQSGEDSEIDIQFELYDYVRDIREILDDLKNSFEQSWEAVYEALSTFLVQYGRFPNYDEEYEGFRLGMWCSNQRVLRNSGSLPQERIEKLDKLGFVWDARDERWNTSYRLVKRYIEKHAGLPKRMDVSEEAGSIYQWISNQKQYFKAGQLSAERAEKLLDLGIDLVAKSDVDSWNENYDLLCDFVNGHGRFPVTSDTKESELIYKLYRWTLRQRQVYNDGELPSQRTELLEKIGFVWDKDEELWNKRFSVLKAFISDNGRLPKAREKYGSDSIGQWYNKQLKFYRNNSLSAGKRKKIEDVMKISQ